MRALSQATLASPLYSWANVGTKLLSLSVPRFPPLENGDGESP